MVSSPSLPKITGKTKAKKGCCYVSPPLGKSVFNLSKTNNKNHKTAIGGYSKLGTKTSIIVKGDFPTDKEVINGLLEDDETVLGKEATFV